MADTHNGRVSFPECKGGDPSGHSPGPWTRHDEQTERNHMGAQLPALREMVEQNQALSWWQEEQYQYMTETGRHHLWGRQCRNPKCAWRQTTSVDPNHPDHPDGERVRGVVAAGG